MLKYRNDGRCPGNGFYTYWQLSSLLLGHSVALAQAVMIRHVEGSSTLSRLKPLTKPREKAIAKLRCSSDQYPCPAGMQYYGRGPIQLTHNYNYGLAGQAIGVDLINNPDLVATGPVISFKTAIWFWMTPQANKPSSHDVIIG
ncbi:CHITINASE-RELATED [Salix purpurea]|uniref:chitinase n=1 Tax=Salix purpurea TaxID=77065 RepID=A0A9Q0V3H1_SALPP|nr:CHITINASE-RELATED [Salix purpurea]